MTSYSIHRTRQPDKVEEVRRSILNAFEHIVPDTCYVERVHVLMVFYDF
jgi:hypothetical protein